MGEQDARCRLPFQGFEPLDANYIYCPNQFLDVVLPHGSRGVVRLVAYLLRRTLGWLDSNGEPIEQEIAASFRELIERAGISRGAIRQAIDDALNLRVIECLQEGRAKAAGTAAQTARYRLRWGSNGDYFKTPEQFDGFFSGEGHRTPIPNSFFDVVVPQEPLGVVKVIGTVLRHTAGYQNQFGGRRSTAPLSHRQISDFARLSDGKTLAEATRLALERGYIECVAPGHFSPDRHERRAACYRVRWRTKATSGSIGSKTPAAKEVTLNRSKIPSENGSESPTGDRFKNPSSRKTARNDTRKQQPVAAEKLLMQLLTAEGFSPTTAQKLVGRHAADVIRRQIDWLDARNPSENRVGMLRKAIEQDWPMPPSIEQKVRRKQLRQREEEHETERRQEDAALAQAKAARERRKARLLAEWESASSADRRRWINAAVARQASQTLASILIRQRLDAMTPHVQVLDALAEDRELPPVSDVAADLPGSGRCLEPEATSTQRIDGAIRTTAPHGRREAPSLANGG